MEAGLAAVEGRRDDARSRYADAQRRLRELGLIVPLALCQLDLVVTGSMESAERRRAADEARATFERLGMRPFLARLDAALAGGPLATAGASVEAGTRGDEVGEPA